MFTPRSWTWHGHEVFGKTWRGHGHEKIRDGLGSKFTVHWGSTGPSERLKLDGHVAN